MVKPVLTATPDSPDPASAAEPGDFRVHAPSEILALLRTLAAEQTRITLSNAAGDSLPCSLSAVDAAQGALGLDVRSGDPQLLALLATDELTAVAYLDQIRLQFELDGLMWVNDGSAAPVLRCQLPATLYRFQRRQTFRVRPNTRTPQARLQHPAQPELNLRLRILDLSIGGLALLLPADVPPWPSGSVLPGVQLELDRDTRLTVTLRLQNARPLPASAGTQLGLTFVEIEPAAARTLQLYIDQTQKLVRMLRKH